jgi:serine/threonine-protein kinase
MSEGEPADTESERTKSEVSGPETRRESTKLQRGQLLAGKYRLELQLGEGGMGFVWSAYHVELELPVAIKLLRPGVKSERVVQRLRLEARAAARLAHPSIVRVLDIACTDAGEPFIVMELLTGQSLADVLARGRMTPAEAVRALLPIADALAHAHSKGVVHRDLKPENVFLSTDEEQPQPRLLDFGIAKLSSGARSLPKLTEKGTVLGSPSYMSPEQVRGDEVDFRSDIWSFCVLLYRAISGTTPFSRTDKREVMQAIMQDEPAALPVGNLIDAQLAELIRWGLRKDPAERPSSMYVLGARLADWLRARSNVLERAAPPTREDRPVPSAPAVVSDRDRATERIVRSSSRPRPRRSRRWAALAGFWILLVGGAVAWAGSGPSPATPRAQELALSPAAPVLVAEVITRPPTTPPETPVVTPAGDSLDVAVRPEPAPKARKVVRARPAPTSELPF